MPLRLVRSKQFLAGEYSVGFRRSTLSPSLKTGSIKRANLVNQNKLSLRGIVPPLVTPLSARDQLDVGGLEKLVHHVLDGGVSGVFILGTTGEAPSLSYRLRRQLIEETVRIVDAQVPVLVGITDTAFIESVAIARHAADCGASATVLTTPYYFPAGQTELTAYVQNIAPLIPLPLMLYNMPGMTKVWIRDRDASCPNRDRFDHGRQG